jgi:hypothetical protein
MKLAMTSIAVTASVCASASEAALLVASFMSFSLDLGMSHRCASALTTVTIFTRNTPRRVFALMSPHSANIDRAKVERQCGGILAHAQPVCAGVVTFLKRPVDPVPAAGHDPTIDNKETQVRHGAHRVQRSH